jgi:glycosidase
MPDLNYRNLDVQQEILAISDFWQKDVGVDGFRVDGARYLFENQAAQSDRPETLAFFEAWRQHYKANDPETFVVGEVWTSLNEASVYDPNTGMDTIFVFDLADTIIGGVRNRNASWIQEVYLKTMAAFNYFQFSTFLTNHDMDRVMNQLSKNPDKMRMASFIYLTGPGVPFIYYGEEIGMLGTKPDEQIRTPMQWTSLENAGFTTGTSWITPKPDYEEKNVALQKVESDSLLHFYQTLIHLRNENLAMRVGDYLPMKASENEIYAVLRVTDDQKLLLVANLSLLPMRDVTFTLNGSSLQGTYTLRPLLGDQSFPPLEFNADGAIQAYQPNVELAGGEVLIFVLE